MTLRYDDVVMAFDFSRIESAGGIRYLFEYSKNGFHFAFPGGAADPTPQLDGSLAFNGAPQYLALPAAQRARFYQQMPTGACTWMVVGQKTMAQYRAFWSCDNGGAGGIWRGVFLYSTDTHAGTFSQGQGLAAMPRVITTAGFIGNDRRMINITTVEATPRTVINGVAGAAAWGAGAFGTAVYDTAIVPRIGCEAGGGSPWLGRLYYLALLRNSIASVDLSQLSGMIANGTKPWCYR